MGTKVKETCTVLSQECIGKDIYSMWIQTKTIAGNAKPGQFVSVYTQDGSKLLPRPISLCEIDKEKGALRLVYRVTGPKTGTESFSRLHAGAQLELLGPLGNGFPLEEAAGRKVFLMGGGIGVPPMLETMKQLDAKKIAVLGYRDELFLNEEFEKNGEVYIATEDGSAGTTGKNHVCFQVILPDRIHYISFGSGRAVFCCNVYLTIFFKFIIICSRIYKIFYNIACRFTAVICQNQAMRIHNTEFLWKNISHLRYNILKCLAYHFHSSNLFIYKYKLCYYILLSLYTKNVDENWLENIALNEAMKHLDEREKHILNLRFFQSRTQMEVAEEIGISQAQVSRLEKSALKQLRKYV